MDFVVDFDLFHWLSGRAAGDWGEYQVSEEGIRSNWQQEVNESASEASLRQRHFASHELSFPTTAVQLIEWELRNEPLDLPKWCVAAVSAKDAETSLSVLERPKKALRRLIEYLDRKAEAMPRAKPYEPRLWILQETRKRRNQLATIEAVETAINDTRARFEAWRDETRRALSANGLAPDALDFCFRDSRLCAQFDRILSRLDWLPAMLCEEDTDKAENELRRIKKAANDWKQAGPVQRMFALVNGSSEHLVARLERDSLFVVENVAKGLESAMAGKAFDQWRDGLIGLLQARGLAETPISYANFLRLTTYCQDDEDAGTYVLREADDRSVSGVGAGASPPVSFPGYSKGEKLAAANHRESANLSFPVTAENLVRWIRDQAGCVWVAIEGSDEHHVDSTRWIEFLAEVAGRENSTKTERAISANAKTSRTNAGREEILEAILANGGSADEPGVRKQLIKQATLAQENNDSTYPFRVMSGKLQKYRARRWNDYDHQALAKSIDSALKSQ